MLLGIMMEQVMATPKMWQQLQQEKGSVNTYAVGVCHPIPQALKWKRKVGVAVG